MDLDDALMTMAADKMAEMREERDRLLDENRVLRNRLEELSNGLDTLATTFEQLKRVL